MIEPREIIETRKAELVLKGRRQHRRNPAFRGRRAWHADKVSGRNVGDPLEEKRETEQKIKKDNFKTTVEPRMEVRLTHSSVEIG